MPFDPAYADAISSLESGGKYGLLGPVTDSGDRAYGKYQVMGGNIAPWTKEILGTSLSPKEFLNDPQAQEAVFEGKFGQYVDKFGPEGAAQAWIGGPGGVGKVNRKDMLGTSIGSYGKQFTAALGGPQTSQPIQAAPQAQQPLSLAAPLSAPQMPQQQMPQQQMAQMPQGAPQSQQGMPQQGFQLPPPLSAPAIQYAIRQFNLARAFARIPTPAGFQGFSPRG